ncbi:MAG: sulfite dehydrogenase [Gammaproteobacteria bacterium]|nr:sulfite dehydrogenase [Gammaproteobacteria bacterium]
MRLLKRLNPKKTGKSESPPSLPRRDFFRNSASVSLASIAASNALAAQTTEPPAWMSVPGKPFSNYGQPSPHENTIRWIADTPGSAGNGVSWTPLHQLEGTITPNGLHFERHHNGVPDIDPAGHTLYIHGLVGKPLAFTLDRLHRYPLQSRVCFIECGGNSNAGWRENPLQTPAGLIHGMLSCSEWTGIPAHYLLEECGLGKSAKWVIAEGADAFGMKVSIPLEKLLDDAILALYQNGEAIRPENGYPLRLILPGWEGVTQVKWLRRLHVADRPVMSRNETAKYTELQKDGTARQFTFPMQTKSLITSPSYGMHLDGPGLYQISGLAWSGNGRIVRVEISSDGGNSWSEAGLEAPVLPKALTRFRAPWRWDGKSAVLKSRATDETGQLQPERDQLIADRGRQGYYHYNAIVHWKVHPEGNIEHSYDNA